MIIQDAQNFAESLLINIALKSCAVYKKLNKIKQYFLKHSIDMSSDFYTFYLTPKYVTNCLLYFLDI